MAVAVRHMNAWLHKHKIDRPIPFSFLFLFNLNDHFIQISSCSIGEILFNGTEATLALLARRTITKNALHVYAFLQCMPHALEIYDEFNATS